MSTAQHRPGCFGQPHCLDADSENCRRCLHKKTCLHSSYQVLQQCVSNGMAEPVAAEMMQRMSGRRDTPFKNIKDENQEARDHNARLRAAFLAGQNPFETEKPYYVRHSVALILKKRYFTKDELVEVILRDEVCAFKKRQTASKYAVASVKLLKELGIIREKRKQGKQTIYIYSRPTA